MKAKKYRISNLEVSTEMKENSQLIESSIGQLDGINAVRVDPYAETVTIDYDDTKVSEKEIQNILKENNFME